MKYGISSQTTMWIVRDQMSFNLHSAPTIEKWLRHAMLQNSLTELPWVFVLSLQAAVKWSGYRTVVLNCWICWMGMFLELVPMRTSTPSTGLERSPKTETGTERWAKNSCTCAAMFFGSYHILALQHFDFPSDYQQEQTVHTSPAPQRQWCFLRLAFNGPNWTHVRSAHVMPTSCLLPHLLLTFLTF